MPEHMWRNADGEMVPLTKVTADAADVKRPTFDELLSDPTQQLDTAGVVLQSVLCEQERDRLRAEGWQACIDYIRRQYAEWLAPEDMYWTERHNPFRTSVIPSAEGRADV